MKPIFALLLVAFALSCESVPTKDLENSEIKTANSHKTKAGTSDSCCAHWTTDTICAHELIAGCVASRGGMKSNPMENSSCSSHVGFVPSGGSATGYLSPTVQKPFTCQMTSVSCQNGILSGPHLFPSCVEIE